MKNNFWFLNLNHFEFSPFANFSKSVSDKCMKSGKIVFSAIFILLIFAIFWELICSLLLFFEQETMKIIAKTPFRTAFVMILQVTEKVLAKCGLSKNFSSRIHKRSRCFFRLTKLHKKTIWKAAAKVNFTNSMQNSSPNFANTMLAEVFFLFEIYFHQF